MANIQALPYSVLLRIFQLCTDFEITFDDSPDSVVLWAKTDDEGIEPFSRVCRNWRNAAQRKLIERIGIKKQSINYFNRTLIARNDLARSVSRLCLRIHADENTASSPSSYSHQILRSLSLCINLVGLMILEDLFTPLLDLSTLLHLRSLDMVVTESNFTLIAPASLKVLAVVISDSDSGSVAVPAEEEFNLIGATSLKTLSVCVDCTSTKRLDSLLKAAGPSLENVDLRILAISTKVELPDAFNGHLDSLKRLRVFSAHNPTIEFNLETILPRFTQMTSLSITNTTFTKNILGVLPSSLLHLELVQIGDEPWIPYKTLVDTSPLNSSLNAPYLERLIILSDESIISGALENTSKSSPLRAGLTEYRPRVIPIRQFFKFKKLDFDDEAAMEDALRDFSEEEKKLPTANCQMNLLSSITFDYPITSK